MTNGAQIAQTILAQLGGNRFIAMTGANALLHGDDHLQFRLGRGALNKATNCRIRLLADDSGYVMTFFKIRGADCKQLSEFEVIPENLRETFTRATGFDCSL